MSGIRQNRPNLQTCQKWSCSNHTIKMVQSFQMEYFIANYLTLDHMSEEKKITTKLSFCRNVAKS
jgi:hypothetical protein